MSVVFVKPAHHYQSYEDFWRLVSVSGYEVRGWDGVDLSQPNVYVFTPYNGETDPAIAHARSTGNAGKIVWWNLERPDVPGERPFNLVLARAWTFVDDVWVSDRWYAETYAPQRYVLMGGHPDFALPDPGKGKQWDVCTYSYNWGRRLDVARQLEKRGIRVAPEAWTDAEKAEVLHGSRLMLNMQQYQEARIVAPFRFFVAACYRMPLLTEALADAEWGGTSVEQADLSGIVTATVKLLRTGALTERADQLHRYLVQDNTFPACVNWAAVTLMMEG